MRGDSARIDDAWLLRCAYACGCPPIFWPISPFFTTSRLIACPLPWSYPDAPATPRPPCNPQTVPVNLHRVAKCRPVNGPSSCEAGVFLVSIMILLVPRVRPPIVLWTMNGLGCVSLRGVSRAPSSH